MARSKIQAALARNGRELGLLLAKKNLAYGNNSEQVSAIMKILFPDGIPVERYDDLFTLQHVANKLCRIANHNDPFGENPWMDTAGYAVLAYTKDRLTKGKRRVFKIQRIAEKGKARANKGRH